MSTPTSGPQQTGAPVASEAWSDRLAEVSASAQDQLFRSARTAKAFVPAPFTADDLREIYDLVKLGPTGGNSSPMRIALVQSAAARRRLEPLLDPPNRPKSASASATAVLAWDTRFYDHYPLLAPHVDDPAARYEGSPEREAARDYDGTLSAHLQAGYFIIGVRAKGFAAGPMGGFDRAGVDREFFPDGRWRSFLVVNIGLPAAGAWRERAGRLAYDDAVTWV